MEVTAVFVIIALLSGSVSASQRQPGWEDAIAAPRGTALRLTFHTGGVVEGKLADVEQETLSLEEVRLIKGGVAWGASNTFARASLSKIEVLDDKTGWYRLRRDAGAGRRVRVTLINGSRFDGRLANSTPHAVTLQGGRGQSNAQDHSSELRTFRRDEVASVELPGMRLAGKVGIASAVGFFVLVGWAALTNSP